MAVAKKVVETKVEMEPVLVGSVDTTEEDVLKYIKEGRKLYFQDDEETFLALKPATQKKLSLDNRKRYDMAKSIVSGVDVTASMETDIAGFDKSEYNVRPGSASANLEVYGKKEGIDYYWERPDNLNKRKAEGWQVNHDKEVHTLHNESCSYSTVGGEKSPEMILLSRPHEVTVSQDKKNAEKRDRLVGQAKNTFKEGVERLGAIATVE